LLLILAAIAVVWVGDWAVWQVRTVRGKGYSTVNVGQFVVAPLKGNKEEYYPDGWIDVRCSNSLFPEGFPQSVNQPCWWLRRHPVVFER
jgi:hypothetical protein